MKKDCKNVEILITEVKRMCDSYGDNCEGCKIYNYCYPDFDFNRLTDISEIVQNWSDEHPELTLAEKFFELFPNAPKNDDGTPRQCPDLLGWCDEQCDGECLDCWGREYSEVKK